MKKSIRTVEVLDKVLKGKRLGWSAVRNYRLAFESLAEYSEDWPVSGIVINEWLGGLDNLADTTVMLYFRLVKAGARYMQRISGKDGYGRWKVGNPCEDAEKPKVLKKRRRYFSPVELVRVIRACEHGYDRELVMTLVDSACRVGELRRLRGRDVGDSFILVEGKTGERRYRLDERLCSLLRELAGGDDGYVFVDRKGGMCSEWALGCRVKRVIQRAGITGSKLGAHTLRHSSASMVALKTKSALAVKALLQHDDVATSMIYIHDVEEVLQQEISPLKLIGESFGEGGEDFVELKQLPMVASPDSDGDGEAEVEGEFHAVVEVDMVDDMFPVIRDDVSVRPLLKHADLVLIRRAMVSLARSGEARSEARAFMRRILRRTG